ncbi:MAG: ATP-binding cassette domain-containing protein [Ruthenibacterium sp.]
MTLAVEHASFGYAKCGEILRDVTFTANAGDLVAVLGPNGSGKTTLLRCMMGFLRWTDGCSTLDGANIRTLPPRKLWQAMAYVPQARNVTAAYTAEEMVLLGRSSRLSALSQPAAQDFDAAHAVMETLHILPLRRKKCSEISGGELQMVLIARALAAQPRVLILDEPESNLDFKNQLLILETLSHLVSDGMTCIFNTHYPAHALQRANQSLLLSRDGHALFGDTSAIVTEQNIEQVFGVKAAIGEVETRGSILQSVVPISVSQPDAPRFAGALETNFLHADKKSADNAAPCIPSRCVLAVVAIIATDSAVAEKINKYLHAYKEFLIGRMGMPYRDGGVFIINVTLDAPEVCVRTLVQRLSNLPGVSVKATFAPEFSAAAGPSVPIGTKEDSL